MNSDRGGAPVGTVLHPAADPAPPGGRGQRAVVPALPRQRRAVMVLLAVLLIGGSLLGGAYLFQSENRRVPVVMVTAAVPAGGVITASDLGTASVAAGPGPSLIPGRELGQVAGHVAATALSPGMLLVPSELTRVLPPGPGQMLVSLPVRPGELPAGLADGDQVLVTATPGAGGQPGSGGAGAPSLKRPVPGTVESVNTTPDQGGFEEVDLIVATNDAIPLAQQASTGQIAVLVTSRNP